MAKRATRYPPKAVEFYFNEEFPKAPPDRRSRPVRGASMAVARLAVEEVLSAHHGNPDAVIRRLTPTAQKVLLRIVTDPGDRDYVFRRDAVSALAALGSPDALVLLGGLALDEQEDPVISGRALNALAKVGGDAAARLIERSLESHPDPYVRTCALKALLKLKHPSSVPVLVRAAHDHPSPLLRDRVRAGLAEMGVAPRGKRVKTRNTGVVKRDRIEGR